MRAGPRRVYSLWRELVGRGWSSVRRTAPQLPSGRRPPPRVLRRLGAARLPGGGDLPLGAPVRAQDATGRAGAARAPTEAGGRAAPLRLPAAARPAGAG